MGKTKEFRLFVTNGIYSVGCNGQTLFFYKYDEEVKRIKDLIYVNFLAISPDNDTLGVKSCDGRLAFYSLSQQKLIKKFRFSKIDYAQDGNCLFLPNGDFVNIENIGSELTQYISFYSAKDFLLIKHFPEQFENVCYYFVEYASESDACFLLGYDRHDDNFKHGYFVGKLFDDKLDKCYITENESEFYLEYMRYPESFSTKEINKKHTLAKLYRYYKENKS